MTSAFDRIRDVVGPQGWSDEPSVMEPLLVDSRRRLTGKARMVVIPASRDEVSKVLSICNEERIAVVPQGGNTGRVGGATPVGGKLDDGQAILLNMSRMNRILALDADNFTMTVEAGTILKTIQDAALEADRFFPLSLGAEGSCQIGGNIASNAGGVNVLRYGNTRDLVLGLEAVLPDGSVMGDLDGLRKNNTGYDLKQLMIGSEGTLGVITAAVLKLFPRPVRHSTAFISLSGLDKATKLLSLARSVSGDALTSFELIPEIALEFAVRHIHGVRRPVEGHAEWYVLFEMAGTHASSDTDGAMETLLGEAMEDGMVTDGTLATSDTQRAELWRLREAIVEAQVREGASIKHDVSVAVSRVPEFITRASEAVAKVCPGIRPYPFGHVGDGNVHYNLSVPANMEADRFLSMEEELHRAVHDVVKGMAGSFSAEHGIGRVKTGEMAHYKNAVDVDIMRKIKETLDPNGIMNPGAVLPQTR